MDSEGIWGIVLVAWTTLAIPSMVRATLAQYTKRDSTDSAARSKPIDSYTSFAQKWIVGLILLLALHEVGIKPIPAAALLSLATAAVLVAGHCKFSPKSFVKTWWAARTTGVKRIISGWGLWVGFVLAYVILLSPFGEYLSDGDVVKIFLWCVVPPAMLLATIRWVRLYWK